VSKRVASLMGNPAVKHQEAEEEVTRQGAEEEPHRLEEGVALLRLRTAGSGR
jgi:hypothetical protein